MLPAALHLSGTATGRGTIASANLAALAKVLLAPDLLSLKCVHAFHVWLLMMQSCSLVAAASFVCFSFTTWLMGWGEEETWLAWYHFSCFSIRSWDTFLQKLRCSCIQSILSGNSLYFWQASLSALLLFIGVWGALSCNCNVVESPCGKDLCISCEYDWTECEKQPWFSVA